jgi:hypothetical protein
MVYHGVSDTWKGFHEICQAARGHNLSLEIVIALILATSAQSKNYSELSILIGLVAVIVVIPIVFVSRISGATKNLNKLAYKRVNLERACDRVLSAVLSNSLSSWRVTTQVVGSALILMLLSIVLRRELSPDM